MYNGYNVIAKSSHLDDRIALDFSYHYLRLRRENSISFFGDRIFNYSEIERIYDKPFEEGWFCQEA